MLQDKTTFLPGQTETKQLKPSQAIRIGAALTPKCIGTLFSNGRTCALGAMWVGYGNKIPDNGVLSVGWYKIYGINGYLAIEISHRNDIGVSREDIADWLEAQGL